MSSPASAPRPPLRAALAERLIIADGAMGSMLQGSPLTIDDFAGHEGCNEILNVTRPDIVRSIHDGYLEAGARIARQAADEWARPDRPRWVLGSIGPGTKLPTLGHVSFAQLRDTYFDNAAALLRGGADALIVETCQDLLQAKAAVI